MTNFAGRWVPGAPGIGFRCRQFVRVADSRGEGMFEVSSKNSKFWYPLLSFSQPPSTVSEENHLDFCENWVLTKFGWKIKIFRFRNDFWVLFISSSGDQINLPICQITLGLSSRVIFISFCEQAKNWARGPKTQKFKVLHFKPNFRGRSNMTSKVIIWPHNINKWRQTILFSYLMLHN